MSIGLAEWFCSKQSDNREIWLKQTETRLAVIYDRTMLSDGMCHWKLYADPNGMCCIAFGVETTCELARGFCDYLMGDS